MSKNIQSIVPIPKGYVGIDHYNIESSLVACFEQVVERYADRLAVDDGVKKLTYGKLNECANRLAHSILDAVGPGEEPVAAVFEQGTGDSLIAMLAILKAGKIFVALDPANPPDRLVAILNDLKPSVIICNDINIALAKQIAHGELKIINVDRGYEQANSENPSIYVAPGSPAVIYYTSGSTGAPKGLIRSHRMTIQLGLEEIKKLFLCPDDNQPLHISLSFAASGPLVWSMWLSGGCVLSVDFRAKTVREIVDWVSEKKISILLLMPGMFKLLLDILPKDQANLPLVRVVITGGESLQARDVRIWQTLFSPKCVLYYALGSSEAGYIAYQFYTKESDVPDILTFGMIDYEKEILLQDEDGSQAQIGEAGEIVIRSRYLCSGYWNKPELTRKTFMPASSDPGLISFFSSDMGRLHSDGSLEFLGRKDNVVKVRGYRVDLAGIETLLYQMPKVKDAVVVAREIPNRHNAKYLVAYVVQETAAALTERDVRLHLSEKLPDYMVPAVIVLLDKLPLNINGKVDKRALPDMPNRPQLDEIDLPSNPVEERLVKIWSALLKQTNISVRDDFFELGGDSLLAMQLLLEIEREFSTRMPLAVISKASNIRQQAEILSSGGVAAYASVLIPVQTSGDKKPVFCISGKGGNPIRFHRLVYYLGSDRPIYFFRSLGLEAGEKIQVTIEDTAADYLREVEEIQSEGPYFFIGESGGGLIAYEMAQQLQRRGKRTGLVAMLDTYLEEMKFYSGPQGLNPLLLARKHAQTLLSGGIRGWGAYLGYYVNLWKFKREDLKEKQARNKILSQYGKDFAVHDRVERSNIVAALAYEPKPYDGRVVMFAAQRQSALEGNEPDHGWKKIGVSGLIVHPLDCYHGNILFEPFVQQVAATLNQYLNQN